MSQTPEPSQPKFAQLPPPPTSANYAVPPAPGEYAGGPQSTTNVLAIIALVASILGALCILPIIACAAGGVMGIVARKQIRARGESGEGLATAAIWVGWIAFGLQMLLVIGYFVMVALAFTVSQVAS